MHPIVDNKGLWVEKYRPSDLETYVGNSHVIEKCKLWLEQGEIPNILLFGPPGSGKTTLAKILANAVDSTVMYLNCSDENSVDTVRDKIKSYASTVGFARWKIIICDEFDYMTLNGQAALSNLMETFSAGTRFILTCNYVEKVIDPIQSRCQTFHISPPSKKDVALRMKFILDTEGIKFTPTDIATIVEANYPDIRRVLNTIQRQVVKGELKLDSQQLVETNYASKVIDILSGSEDMKAKFTNIRQLIADSKVKDYTPLYRHLYDSLDKYATGHIAGAILVIAEAQYNDAFVVDKEINVMSMIVKLLNELNS